MMNSRAHANYIYNDKPFLGISSPFPSNRYEMKVSAEDLTPTV